MKPRVLFIGNLADLPFHVVRLLREKGVDAELLVLDTPSCQKHNESWVIGVKPGVMGWPARLRTFLSHDVLVGTSSGISYAWLFRLLGKRVFAFSMGSDFRRVYFERGWFGWLMRRGFRNSEAVFYANPDQRALFESEGFTPLFVPLPVAGAACPDRRLKRKTVFFCPSRISWSGPSAKDTHRFIEGFAKFLKTQRHPDRFELRMVRWGPDVDKAEALVARLGIEDRVVFLPFMSQEELAQQFGQCDAVVDQFNVGSMGMIATQAMACGRPVFAWIDSKAYARCFGEVPPVFNCRTSGEVASALAQMADKKAYARAGAALRRWVGRFHAARNVVAPFLKAFR